MVNHLNSACDNCTKHAEHEKRLYCVNVAEREIFDIFKILGVPSNEQDILVKTINNENTCWYNLKQLLDTLLIRNK